MRMIHQLTRAIILGSSAIVANGWVLPLSQKSRPATLGLLGMSADEDAAAAGEIFIPGDAVIIPEDEMTGGIPNKFLKTEGVVKRVAESNAEGEGLLFETGREFSIITTDVIDMVQQAAEDVDHLDENLLIEGMYFDSFMEGDSFRIVGDDDDDKNFVMFKITGARMGRMEMLEEVDEAKRPEIVDMLSWSPGLCGWNACVIQTGRIQSGYKIQKAN